MLYMISASIRAYVCVMSARSARTTADSPRMFKYNVTQLLGSRPTINASPALIRVYRKPSMSWMEDAFVVFTRIGRIRSYA